MPIITRILRKLDEVRLSGRTAFGSERHQYQLNAPLPEETVRAFEAREAVQLPPDYREFVLRAGDGGAGPYYGLMKLADGNEEFHDDEQGALARPCLLHPGGASFLRDNDGVLAIADQGCTFWAVLIITGSCRGRVVYVDLQGNRNSYFVHDPDFLSWYERWLDELLWGYDDFWFGYGLPGREEQLAEVLRDRQDLPDLVCESMATLGRIPHLRTATLATLQSLLRHRHWEVRARSVSLIGKHRVFEALDSIRALLTDENDGVRKNALAALANFPAVDWEPAARAALASQTPELARSALFLLKNAGLLRPEDVEALNDSKDAEIRQYGKWAADELRCRGNDPAH